MTVLMKKRKTAGGVRLEIDVAHLRKALERAWKRDTSLDPERWSERNPAWGQCAVTSILVQDFLGGTLLRSVVDGRSHYWNRLPSGEEVDLTRHQFKKGVRVGAGELRSRDYVLSFPETQKRYLALKSAVLGALKGGSRKRRRDRTEENDA